MPAPLWLGRRRWTARPRKGYRPAGGVPGIRRIGLDHRRSHSGRRRPGCGYVSTTADIANCNNCSGCNRRIRRKQEVGASGRRRYATIRTRSTRQCCHTSARQPCRASGSSLSSNLLRAVTAFPQSSDRLPMTDRRRSRTRCALVPPSSPKTRHCSIGPRRLVEANTGSFVKAQTNGPGYRAFPGIATTSQGASTQYS